MSTSARTRRPRTDWLVVIVPAMLMLVMLAPAASAVVAPCRVTNVTTQQVYEGSGANLQTAINQAAAGTTLRIRGVCVGSYVVGKTLRLVGVETAAFPTPTLDGDGAGRLLDVTAGTVTLADLTVTNGVEAGIRNVATLILNGSTSVTRNGFGIINDGTVTVDDDASIESNGEETSGGGIYNTGTLTLRGSASIDENRGGSGAGIVNLGTVRLQNASSVSGNRGFFFGGGINNSGVLILSGFASVSDNTAFGDHSEGGGIFNSGRVRMAGSSSVSGNI